MVFSNTETLCRLYTLHIWVKHESWPPAYNPSYQSHPQNPKTEIQILTKPCDWRKVIVLTILIACQSILLVVWIVQSY